MGFALWMSDTKAKFIMMFTNDMENHTEVVKTKTA